MGCFSVDENLVVLNIILRFWWFWKFCWILSMMFLAIWGKWVGTNCLMFVFVWVFGNFSCILVMLDYWSGYLAKELDFPNLWYPGNNDDFFTFSSYLCFLGLDILDNIILPNFAVFVLMSRLRTGLNQLLSIVSFSILEISFDAFVLLDDIKLSFMDLRWRCE